MDMKEIGELESSSIETSRGTNRGMRSNISIDVKIEGNEIKVF